MIWAILASAAAGAPSVNLIGDLLVPAIIALVAGSVGAALVSQIFASADRRRDHYSESVAVLVSWCEYPYMIRRRVNDKPATLQRLADHGHQLQERIARSEAWVTAESKYMGAKYSDLVEAVKEYIAPLIKEAWASAPATSPTEMVLDGWGSEMCSATRKEVNEFRVMTSRRFGLKRFVRRGGELGP